jgi:hypothetical protein
MGRTQFEVSNRDLLGYCAMSCTSKLKMEAAESLKCRYPTTSLNVEATRKTMTSALTSNLAQIEGVWEQRAEEDIWT